MQYIDVYCLIRKVADRPSSLRMFDAGHHSPDASTSLRHPLGNASTLRETYAIRLMAGYIASLAILLGIVHLPVYQGPERLAWRPANYREQITLQDLKSAQKAQQAGDAVPATSFRKEETTSGAGTSQRTLELQSESPPEPAEPLRRMEVPKLERAVLDFAEVMPQVVGGVRAFYINIEYPEDARRAGIEGQLILSFIVEPDGTPTDIKVLRSLHPLCDSAAVRALRDTRFMPGRRNGEEVRVRMHLPVRFTLIDPPPSEDS